MDHFFPGPISAIFNKIFSNSSKCHSQFQVSNANFSGFYDYLEDPPWLGPTKKILKKWGFQDWLKTINFMVFSKEIPGDFWGILHFVIQPAISCLSVDRLLWNFAKRFKTCWKIFLKKKFLKNYFWGFAWGKIGKIWVFSLIFDPFKACDPP